MKESVHLTVEGIDIIGEMYLPEGEKTSSALCICHGIPSGKPADPLDGGYPLLAEKFCAAGFITLIFNFRGTGISGGDFDIMGWTRDLWAVIDYLYYHPKVENSHIYVMGFSGGAATSTYVAAHDPRISKVVLCACPSGFNGLIDPERAGAMIKEFRDRGMIRSKDFPLNLYEWFSGFRDIAPIDWIAKISPRSLLILHGNKDELIELNHAKRLYNKAGEPKEITIIEEGKHKLRLSEKAMDTALEWLKSNPSIKR